MFSTPPSKLQNKTKAPIHYPKLLSTYSSLKPPKFPPLYTENKEDKNQESVKKPSKVNPPMDISVGSHVEICSNEDGFLGSYYAAKVISKLGKERFRVEYTTLLANNQKGPLKEVVQASVLRPLPPHIGASSFNVLDKVDAYDLDGWWVGRVTGRRVGSKYVVHFECSGDEYVYPVSALRVHQEYENGQWVPSQQKARTQAFGKDGSRIMWTRSLRTDNK